MGRDVALNDCVHSESVLDSPVRAQLKTKRKMHSVDKYLKTSELFKEMALFLSTCGEAEFFDKLEYLKHLTPCIPDDTTIIHVQHAMSHARTDSGTLTMFDGYRQNKSCKLRVCEEIKCTDLYSSP